jgi:tetratricopeptide (TPR) repeat protein
VKRWLVIVTAVLVVAGVALLARPRAPEWTTASPEARAELQAGLAAEMKLYFPDARRHYEKALKLDPEFVIAKLRLSGVLARLGEKGVQTQLMEEIRAADLHDLTARERFMISYAIARSKRDDAAAEEVLKAYVAKHPDDPFALSDLGGREVLRGDWAAAEASYEQLAEVAPNWVLSYNNLGYMLMAQGRFDQAEEMLRKYRFIAPDQANPHDSLGELLVIVGRYDEAEQEFHEALRARSDFLDSLVHLISMYLYSGQMNRAEAALEQARGGGAYPPDVMAFLEREVSVWRAAYADDWRAALDAAGWKPGADAGDLLGFVHLGLCRLGRFDDAEKIEGSLQAGFEKAGANVAMMKTEATPALPAHLAGVRLALQGDYRQAIGRFAEADDNVFYYGMNPGMFKLLNLAWLAQTESAAGESAQAAATLGRIREVNAPFAATFGGADALIVHLKRR